MYDIVCKIRHVSLCSSISKPYKYGFDIEFVDKIKNPLLTLIVQDSGACPKSHRGIVPKPDV